MRKFVAAGGTAFTEHDLRAKVASDEPGEVATARLQHRNATTTKRFYDRLPGEVAVLHKKSPSKL
jgi:hypothetical protein